jgi:hypothetical protein
MKMRFCQDLVNLSRILDGYFIPDLSNLILDFIGRNRVHIITEKLDIEYTPVQEYGHFNNLLGEKELYIMFGKDVVVIRGEGFSYTQDIIDDKPKYISGSYSYIGLAGNSVNLLQEGECCATYLCGDWKNIFKKSS